MILSGYQLMVKNFAAQRPSLRNVWQEAFPANGPAPKSLIEISGEQGTGKSILLYELMARSSLSTFYGGKFCQIIFLDLTHKIDFKAINDFVLKLMTQNSIVCSQRSFENPIEKYCASIIYLPCYSPEQFEFAFEECEKLLWNYKQVALLAIDGLDTFYWDECYYQLQRMATHYKKLIQRLKPLCEEHNICCAYTVDASYLTLKSSTWSNIPQSLIDYKLKLKQKDEHFYVNDLEIKINHDGIQFVK